MSLRLKMQVQSVSSQLQHTGVVGDEGTRMEHINLTAVTSEGAGENAAWSKWTPSGQLQFLVTNPDAQGKLAKDDIVYVTLEKATPNT